MPMRNIPFKVVCLLGMSEGMFPRSSVPVNFDLMQGQRRRGDRSRRLDDRYLFLEAILACRSHLHMSWVGRDIRDDNELPPSLLISEVRDYLADALLIQGDETLAASEAAKRVLAAMTYHHPLQAFHPRYFVEGPMQSYDPVWAACLQKKPAIEPFAARPLSAALEPEHWVELRQLEAMFTKPCEVFLQRQLGVYFNEAQQEDEDSEPFELSALENWHLKQQALEQRLTRPEQRAEFMAQRAASGLLPVFEAGQLALQKADESVASLSLMLQCLQPDRASLNSKEELRLDLGQHGLFGALSKAHRGIRYYAKPGQLKGRDLMRAWLRHLFANACHPDAGEMWALGADAAGVESILRIVEKALKEGVSD